MSLDHSLAGKPSEPQERSGDSKDALLYAIGVGAGLGDPLQELEFTTENCEGIEQQVLPTFAVLIAAHGVDLAADSDTPLFQAAKPDGTVVIDRGRLRVREA